jgi:hypothetical protein
LSFIEEEQKMVCESLGVAWNPIETHSLIAFNESLFTSIKPINGLRHPKQAVIDGWYLWGGSEIPDDEHYFKPIHVEHLIEKKGIILRYLALPAGCPYSIGARTRAVSENTRE